MSRKFTYLISAWIVIAFCLSCTKEDTLESMEYGEAIRLNTRMASTRGAVIFEGEGEDPLKNEAVGGGDFSASAFLATDGKCYFRDAWVRFFKGGTDRWHFRDDGGTPSDFTDDAYIDRYWPKGYDMNFFAYMPYRQNMGNTHVTIGGYAPAAGPSFSCELPLDNEQDNMQEFIYAFATDQNQTTQGADGVDLRFVHPFSSVRVMLKESYRMTIKTIAFENIYYKGTYSNSFSTVDFGGDPASNFTSACWVPAGTRSDMILQINEYVPGENINFNSEVGGPYMVMPQDLTGIEFAITFERDDIGIDTKRIAVATSSVTSWEPGNRYTYNIVLGDPQEEILFNVLVDEWGVVDYKQEIDVQ